jgi:integrase
VCDQYESEGDTDSHIVLNLALNFGLRRNEIFNSRRAWIEIPDKGPARVGVFSERSFHVKSGEDGYAFGSAVSARKLLELSEGFDYLVSSRNPRTCLDPVVADLRGIGWGDKCKPLHECRKLYGSYLATTQSLYYAQKSLRHASAMTTNDFYADLMTDDSVISLWGT